MLMFSIVIPTYKRNNSLCECLNCLIHYTQPSFQDQINAYVEVVISDDAHDPELEALLQQSYPWCSYLRGPAKGPAGNRNHAAHHAKGDWLVFTDDDCLPQEGWIEAYARHSSHLDIMEGRTSATGTRYQIDDECPINEIGGYLWSCNFAIRRGIFLEMGGFDERFPSPAIEDVEFNVRIGKKGLRRSFVPTALVLHPWRRRKGFEFITVKANSLSTFIRLHPEYAQRFTLKNQLVNSMRSFRKNILLSFEYRQTNGLLRQVVLDFYLHFMTWFSVWRQ